MRDKEAREMIEQLQRDYREINRELYGSLVSFVGIGGQFIGPETGLTVKLTNLQKKVDAILNHLNLEPVEIAEQNIPAKTVLKKVSKK